MTSLQEYNDASRWLKPYALQRKPYITLADALDGLYQEFRAINPSLQSKTAPFDFTLLEHSNKEPAFHFILSYSAEKFASILSHRRQLAALVDDVFSGTDRDPRNLFHRDRVRHFESTEPLDFITAVFHLSYTYRVPIQFNPGRIFERHSQDHRPFYRAELLRRRDQAGLAKIRIGNSVYSQVPDSFLPSYQNGEPFYQDWIAIVQGMSQDSAAQPAFHYHLYMPIYDGPHHRQGVLRGILGAYFADRTSRNQALAYFRNQADHIQNQLNQAFHAGTASFILDGYLRSTLDPLVYLQKRSTVLHHWQEVVLLDEADAPAPPELWWLQDQTLYLAIENILARQPDQDAYAATPAALYRNKVLAMRFPPLENVDLRTDASYVQNRVRQWTQLLDALLEKRKLLAGIETTRNASRRSAVAAIMSRNMSHNIGSHVLAHLAQQARTPAGPSLSRFHAYLATRMDFLADVSTRTGSVMLAKRFYRDVIHEFKSQQTLLLDHISGTSLTGDRISLIGHYEGRRLTLNELDSDPIIALPNDILGAQALYVILENIIRNCAKHSRIQDELRLDLELERTLDLNRAYYRLRIRDHLSGCLQDPNLIHRINDALRQPIIREDGSLHQGHWGLLEMKIAAAYLRQEPPERLDQISGEELDPGEPPLLHAVEVEHSLCYELYLFRPQFLLIVHPPDWQISAQRLQVLAAAGISCTPASHRALVPPALPFEFVLLLDQPLPIPLQNSFSRVIRISGSEERLAWRAGLEQDSAEAIMARLWQLRNRLLWKKIPTLCIAWGESSQTPSIARYQLAHQSEGEILFDLHGEWAKKPENQQTLAQLKYYQPYGSTSPTGLLLNGLNSVSAQMRDWMVGEFLEAAWTVIAVVDERVQQQAVQPSDTAGHQPMWITFRRMRLFVPTTEIDLNRQTLTEKDEIDLLRWLKTLLDQEELNFVIIHLGVVEKLTGTDPKAIQAWLDRLTAYLENRVSCVLISGRGTPSYLPKDRPFLPYSLVAKYILEQPSKYHLNKILYAGFGKTLME
ncbi:hypothetical protein GX408_01310 [bacterium]|nr:hypothetical protein [bacterium]